MPVTANPSNGWTGGQYSVFRCVMGSYLLIHFLHLIPWGAEVFSNAGMLADASASPLYPLFPNVLFLWDSPTAVVTLLAAGAGLAVAFALGVHDRTAALILWYLWACLFTRNPLISNPGLPFIGWILLAHAFVPTRPYGSWDARVRVDPGGGWRFPVAIHTAALIVMAISYSYSGYTKLASPSWLDGSALLHVLSNPLARPTILRETLLALPHPLIAIATWSALGLEIAFAPMAIFRKLRPWLWLAMLGMHLSLMTLIDFSDLSAGMVMLQFFTFDPAWVKGKDGGRVATIFYDGGCGLCHRFVRFAIAEDREGERFRFAPLEGGAFAALRESSDQPEVLDDIDSIVLSLPDGSLLVRAGAVLEIGKRMGGLWRVATTAAGLFPMRVLDASYDGIARIRRRIFAQPPDACPLLPEPLRERFELD